MAAQYQFVMRSGPTVGKNYPLEAPEITIGRESSNTITINDVEVSRRHARMELRGNAYVLQDIGSTNGTFVNGQRVLGMQVLNPGDSVALGEGIVLNYESIADPNATVLSSNRPPEPASAPTAVAPAPIMSQPAPAYSGQVPAGPAPTPGAPAAKKRFPIWLLIVIVLLVIICACVGVFLIIDQLNLWCKVVPFLVPLLGGSCG